MSITRVNQWTNTNPASLAVTPGTIGNVIILTSLAQAGTPSVGTPAGGGVTTWHLFGTSVNTSAPVTFPITCGAWWGIITSTGSSTITMGGSVGGGAICATEYTSSLGYTNWFAPVMQPGLVGYSGNSYAAGTTTAFSMNVNQLWSITSAPWHIGESQYGLPVTPGVAFPQYTSTSTLDQMWVGVQQGGGANTVTGATTYTNVSGTNSLTYADVLNCAYPTVPDPVGAGAFNSDYVSVSAVLCVGIVAGSSGMVMLPGWGW